jgi:DNA-binding CsgD family transcriptional regulator
LTGAGRSVGPAPDRFLVGLATLTLVAEVAEPQPLVCIIDDTQWLDHSSAQILGFIARRLLAERIVLVCAARTGIGDDVLAGLPELPIHGLGDSDARALLLDNVPGPLDAAVCDQIVTESHGNPLALLELPRTWNASKLAGGFGLPGSQPVVSKIEQSYARRLLQLPADTQLLVLAAAAEPLGDPVLLTVPPRPSASTWLPYPRRWTPGCSRWVAASSSPTRWCGRPPTARRPPRERHRVHGALAEATDAETDPDRRAWHLAQATPGPGEEVAAELERSAGRAQARGGVAAAAAFLQRAVALTVDPARRAERALAAAQATLQAGAFDAALGLLTTAEAGPLDDFQRARVDLVRGHVAFASGLGGEAPSRLLLNAARRLEPYDLELARETYLTAWGAAVNSAHSAEGNVLVEICHAVRALPRPPGGRHPLDLLLDGLALLTSEGRAAATPMLQRAGKAVANIPVEDVLRWGWMAPAAFTTVWDDEGYLAMAERVLQLVRDTGAFAELPIHLETLGIARASIGDFAGAALLIAESESAVAATGSRFAPYTALRLRALQGREAEASGLIASAIEQAAAGGQRIAATVAYWGAAVLYNGLARYKEATSAARQATSNTLDPWIPPWVLPELVEAAARQGNADLAREALEWLAETTQPCGTDWALGIEARSRALLSDGAAADDLHREAIDRLRRTQMRPELARAHLLYGEWLRRQGGRVDAREQLRTAHEMLAAIGMEAFAQRARRELMATGEKVRKRSPETREELTAQEEQIARLARDGLSNLEIGAQLFISARTVEWHLRRVFTKLDISSRRQLRVALPEGSRPLARA